MVTIYEACHGNEPTFWDIYEGSKRLGDVLQAGVKLYNADSKVVVRESKEGKTGYIHIDESFSVMPQCVDEIVKRYPNRAIPDERAPRQSDCPDENELAAYVHEALMHNDDYPEDAVKKLEDHFSECDGCFTTMLFVYGVAVNWEN